MLFLFGSELGQDTIQVSIRDRLSVLLEANMTDQRSTELARRAKAIYARVKDQLEQSHLHQFIAIEPDSEKYFFGETLDEAVNLARAAYPDRLVHVMRVGHRAAIHIGGWSESQR